MGVIRNYADFDEEFTWHNQTIDKKLVNFVRVRIYRRANIITSDGAETLIGTDTPAIIKSPKDYLYLSGHTFAIFSTGICAKPQKPFLYLHIKVCLTNNFDIAKLDEANFLEKPYVMAALGNIWLV